jgi:hypothetical protein
MAQKFISFYFLDWSKDGDYFSTKIHRVYSRDNQFNDITTQDAYIKEHNLSKRTALQLDKVTEVKQVLVDIPVFYVKYGTTYYFLSYSEGNKLIDSLLTINDYKK